MGTVFFAGIYGVGKSTVIDKISNMTGVRAYSAGDLISEKNGELYSTNKAVSNKDHNQRILIQRVAELLERNKKILLAGHFCIINKLGKIEELPSYVFDKINLEKIILLEAPTETIITHLNVRDDKCYSQDLIQSMLITEREAAQDASERLGISLIKYEMQYSEADETFLIDQI